MIQLFLRRFALGAGLLGVGIVAQASGPGALFTCLAHEGEIQGKVSFTPEGPSTLDVRWQGQHFACPLRMGFAADRPQAVIPHQEFELLRGECSPALPAKLRDELLDRVLLQIRLAGAPARRTSLQWLQYVQPAACDLQGFREDEVRGYLKRWRKGEFGGARRGAPEN